MTDCMIRIKLIKIIAMVAINSTFFTHVVNIIITLQWQEKGSSPTDPVKVTVYVEQVTMNSCKK